MNKALITGGTGVLGTTLVRKFQQHQLDFLTISRKEKRIEHYTDVKIIPDLPWKRADLLTGEGLSAALHGINIVIHLASAPREKGEENPEITAMRQLVRACQANQIEHLIYISIVGVDKVPLPYYQAKRAAEQVLQQSGVPYTILRATQFHEFADFMIGQMMRYPIGLVPKKFKVQPISLDATAEALLQIAQDKPQNQILNLGGREVLALGDMVKRWKQYRAIAKPVLNLPIVNPLMRTIATGGLTCPSNRAMDSITWENYLQRQYNVAKIVAS